MTDISQEVQKEVARIRDTISTIKALLPNGRGSFTVYEIMIAQAEKAVREQDAAALVRLLPELREMH
jgi:DNA-directed RNA polymerase specialized sigma54-like protein